jgi:PAS domain-containing protein
MAIAELDGQQYPWLEAQLQAILNLIPAHTWYALPSGAVTFLNERCADYLGLPKNHPLRFGIDTLALIGIPMSPSASDDHEKRRVGYGRPV